MFGSEILEVAIGLVLVFIIVSMMASAIRELLEGLLHTRAAYLERGVREILNDKNGADDGLARAFYNHPLIASLTSHTYSPGDPGKLRIFARGRRFPSYIPAKNFALAIMDIAVRGKQTNAASGDPNSGVADIETIRSGVVKLGNPEVQRAVLMAIDSAQGNLVQARLELQAWFDSGMDRVSGWYKRSTSWILFWVGFGIAITMNVDTVAIAHYLYTNKAERQVIVAHAERVSKDSAYVTSSLQVAKADLDSLQLPIGWNNDNISPNPFSDKFPWHSTLGWILIAVAATVGAPFWFDLLNKFMIVRSTVKPHEKSPEESSEDRQQPKIKSDGDGSRSAVPLQLQNTSNAEAAIAMARFLTSGAVATTAVADPDTTIDACDVEMDPDRTTAAITITRDEDLPAAEGGVAQ